MKKIDPIQKMLSEESGVDVSMVCPIAIEMKRIRKICGFYKLCNRKDKGKYDVCKVGRRKSAKLKR